MSLTFPTHDLKYLIQKTTRELNNLHEAHKFLSYRLKYLETLTRLAELKPLLVKLSGYVPVQLSWNHDYHAYSEKYAIGTAAIFDQEDDEIPCVLVKDEEASFPILCDGSIVDYRPFDSYEEGLLYLYWETMRNARIGNDICPEEKCGGHLTYISESDHIIGCPKCGHSLVLENRSNLVRKFYLWTENLENVLPYFNAEQRNSNNRS